jgi:hypothetical protein
MRVGELNPSLAIRLNEKTRAHKKFPMIVHRAFYIHLPPRPGFDDVGQRQISFFLSLCTIQNESRQQTQEKKTFAIMQRATTKNYQNDF